jgi:hypothetical protein
MPSYLKLRRWRDQVARQIRKADYTVMSEKTLLKIAVKHPKTIKCVIWNRWHDQRHDESPRYGAVGNPAVNLIWPLLVSTKLGGQSGSASYRGIGGMKDRDQSGL